MNRTERRAARSDLSKRATAWPEHLVEVPESEWPERKAFYTEWPTALWRSRHYLVQVFEAPAMDGVEAKRLSVNRTTLGTAGRWQDGISWEDLMGCKRATGHGDWYGVEVYPRDRDIVNVANMRHLWLFAEPLAIGWFADTEGPQVP